MVVGESPPLNDVDLYISPDDLQLTALIGKGASGEVYVSGAVALVSRLAAPRGVAVAPRLLRAAPAVCCLLSGSMPQLSVATAANLRLWMA